MTSCVDGPLSNQTNKQTMPPAGFALHESALNYHWCALHEGKKKKESKLDGDCGTYKLSCCAHI
jgi:hypothetical protein